MAELNTLTTLLGPKEFAGSGHTPTAYYRFESGAETTDSSGNSHTLTAVNTPTYDTGKFGQGAVLTSASSEYFTIADHANWKPTGAFTVGGWMKSSTTGVAATLFGSYFQGANIGGFVIHKTAANVATFISGKNTGSTVNTDYKQITGTTNIVDGNWHWVVATSDGSTISLYVDGVLDVSVAWANHPAYNASNQIAIGAYYDTSAFTYFYNGSLDDIFLINGTALTATQISTIYGVQAYYRFESNANDSKGTKNLTTSGSPTYASGRFGNAVDLEASSSQYLYHADDKVFDLSNTMTLSMWIKVETMPSSLGRYVLLINKGNDTNGAYNLYILQNNKIFFATTATGDFGDQTGTSQDSALPDITGTWKHIVITHVASTHTTKLYVDGVEEPSTEFGTATSIYNSGSQFRVGFSGRTDENDKYFDGMIDDLAVFNRALTAGEVLSIYRSNAKGALFFAQY